MLVPMSRLLEDAQAHNYALIAPDFLSIHMMELELEIAQALNTPVIISYPALALDRFRPWQRWGQKLVDRCRMARVPVCLHLDHGKSVGICTKAMDAGFTSVMIDGSAHGFETNVAMTRAVVRAARDRRVDVEGEIGHVGKKRKNANHLTRPGAAARFVQQTGVNALAVSIGTCHGHYRGQPKLDFRRLQQIREWVDVPLVLHGGSGTGEKNLKKTIALGIRKINLFTEFFTPYVAHGFTHYRRHPLDILRPGKHPPGQREILEPILKKYFHISGSLGRARGKFVS